jgi:hypothetical protein
VYGQQLFNQVASIDDPCWWHHMCFGFLYASFVLLYVVKFLRIVNIFHNVDNGSKTTLISCDVARCKGGEFLCWNNIDITWRFSLYQLHCCKQLNPKCTKKIMQNNIKVINCTIAILHSRALWASQTKSDTRSWVLLGFCYTLNSDSLKP